jgi:hypothetical protein
MTGFVQAQTLFNGGPPDEHTEDRLDQRNCRHEQLALSGRASELQEAAQVVNLQQLDLSKQQTGIALDVRKDMVSFC